MKLSTLMLAGLMTLTSVAAFAEDGSERAQAYYANIKLMQEQSNAKAKQTAVAETQKLNASPATQNTDESQPKS
jgi:hypothetical protein